MSNLKDNKIIELDGIKNIKRSNISTELFNYFKDSIVSSKLEAGSLLPTELELCKHTGVSRSTIREVLSALSFMNLIIRTKRGTFISDNPNLYKNLPFPEILKKVHAKEVINFRVILECEIVRLVAENADKDDIQELQKSLEKMKSSKDINTLMKADTSFHVNLGIASHNELFSLVLKMIRNELEEQICDVFSRDKYIRKRAINHHERIFQAIKEGNVNKARNAMSEHIIDVAKTIDKLNK